MFTKTAAFYDLIYHWKDYAAEADKLTALIKKHKRSSGSTLLDVGCGTGKHLEQLHSRFTCEGLDLDPELLQIARERLPDVPLHHADMLDFDLARTFDVVVCLFGSVAYTQTVERYHKAIANMARHVESGGLLIIEPFIFKEQYTPGRITLHTGETPGLAVARMISSRIENGTAHFAFNYLVGTSDGVQHLEEEHVLGLFTRDEYAAGLEAHCAQVIYDEEGLMGRGLFIAVR